MGFTASSEGSELLLNVMELCGWGILGCSGCEELALGSHHHPSVLLGVGTPGSCAENGKRLFFFFSEQLLWKVFVFINVNYTRFSSFLSSFSNKSLPPGPRASFPLQR